MPLQYYIITEAVVYINMEISTCLESATNNSSLLILFGRILPYLVQGLLFGGVAPYIIHISDVENGEFNNGK